MPKRQSLNPSEQYDLLTIAESLLIKRINSVKGIMQDLFADLDYITEHKYVEVVIMNVVDLAVKNMVIAMINQGLTGNDPDEMIAQAIKQLKKKRRRRK